MLRSRSARLLLIAVLAAGTSYYYYGLFLPHARAMWATKGLDGPYSQGGDFYPIWLTTRNLILEHRNPYSEETTREIQTGVFGRPLDTHHPQDPPLHYRAFSYPLYVDILAAPLALISFHTVQIAGALLLPLLVVASVVLWFRALRISVGTDLLVASSVLTMVSYPVLEAVYTLQPALVVSLLLSASIAALAGGRQGLAGLLLALATTKPQMVVLLILMLIAWTLSDWRSRKRFGLSFALTFSAMLLASLLVLPTWLLDWWRVLVEYRGYTDPPLAQLVFGKVMGNLFALLLLLLVGWIAWRARRYAAASSEFGLTVAITLAATIVLVPSSIAVYDHVILLPAIAWLYGAHYERRSPGLLGWTGLLSLGWQWIAASAVSIALLFLPNLRHNPFAIVLPLRTASSVPFIVLAMLGVAFVARFQRSEAPVAEATA